jgi:hypothetical protein
MSQKTDLVLTNKICKWRLVFMLCFVFMVLFTLFCPTDRPVSTVPSETSQNERFE